MMENKDFGQLVAVLRKEIRNEFDETMTQTDLAELARIPLITLQKIEQGRQVNIKADVLLNLAEALHLNSRASQTFFLSSLGIKTNHMAKPTTSPQEVLARLTQVLSNMQTPALITDSFGDILFINRSIMAVYDLQVSQLYAPQFFSQHNYNRFFFSPEFEDLRKMMGKDQFVFLNRLMKTYKWNTMSIRNHWYFLQVLPELNRFPIFRQYWQSQFTNDEDLIAQAKFLSLNHPRLGNLKLLSSPTQVITLAGDLYLSTYQPLDAHTGEVFLQLARELGTQPLQLAHWPKPPTPAGLQIK
jgi:transcriptional regulator with XRE-family HTH domain